MEKTSATFCNRHDGPNPRMAPRPSTSAGKTIQQNTLKSMTSSNLPSRPPGKIILNWCFEAGNLALTGAVVCEYLFRMRGHTRLDWGKNLMEKREACFSILPSEIGRNPPRKSEIIV